MARRLKKSGHLNPPSVVGTLMTNFSLERMLRDEGITLTRVAVGDLTCGKAGGPNAGFCFDWVKQFNFGA